MVVNYTAAVSCRVAASDTDLHSLAELDTGVGPRGISRGLQGLPPCLSPQRGSLQCLELLGFQLYLLLVLLPWELPGPSLLTKTCILGCGVHSKSRMTTAQKPHVAKSHCAVLGAHAFRETGLGWGRPC